MSDTIIRVENLGKRYQLGRNAGQDSARYRTLRDDLMEVPRRVASRLAIGNRKSEIASDTEFWALREVSFEVKQGEVVGIIGRNGAGKSTLLKILSRITEPTTGKIHITGRVASLLEVGTGFHPELTGRENIFLNGAILGMSHAEIKAKFHAIVTFAEIERFLETPVKRYSSGMYVRLAFAVAAHLDPEILIVDEVLAVGDAEFQKKCLGKMQDVSRSGRTVLFVSHNMQAISTLTSRALVLSSGTLIFNGATEAATSAYLQRMKTSRSTFTSVASSESPRVLKATVETSEPNGVHIWGEPLRITFILHTPTPLRGASFSFQIVNQHDQPIVHLWTFDSERPMCRTAGSYQLDCTIPKSRLYMGHYSLKFYYSGPPGGDLYHSEDHVCSFDVTMFGIHREFEWVPETCTYIEDASWSVCSLPASGFQPASTGRHVGDT